MSPLFLIFFREEILKGIERLKYSIPAGHEHIYLGLWKVRRAGATFALRTIGPSHNDSPPLFLLFWFVSLQANKQIRKINSGGELPAL